VRVDKRRSWRAGVRRGAGGAPSGTRWSAAGSWGGPGCGLLVDKYDDACPCIGRSGASSAWDWCCRYPHGGPGDVEHGNLLRPIWRQRCRRCWRRESCIDGTGLPVLDRALWEQASGRSWGYVGTPTWRRTFSSRREKQGQREGELGPRTWSTCARATQCGCIGTVRRQSFKREDSSSALGGATCTRRYFREGVGWRRRTAALPIAGYKKLYGSRPKSATKTRPPSGRRERRGGRRSSTTSSHGAGPISRTSHHPRRWAKRSSTPEPREALARFWSTERFRSTTDVERLHVRAALTRKNISSRGFGPRARAPGDRVHHPGLLPPCGRYP